MMKFFLSTLRAAAGITVAGLVLQPLAGCSGGSQLPVAGVAPMRTVAAGRATMKSHKSWVSPEAARAPALLYVADTTAATVDIYLWPSLLQVGILTGFKEPGPMCVDKRGDIYITDANTWMIWEYPHGGVTPIAALNDLDGPPQACSIDPQSGNLAVGTLDTISGPGNVLIFAGARGSPTAYAVAGLRYVYFPAYDDSGNLFVDGFTAGGGSAFAELPSGSSAFEEISLQQRVVAASGLEWDGKYVALADSSTDTIYQLSISGGVATAVGSTSLQGGTALYQFWITGGTKRRQGTGVVGAFENTRTVGVWNYPAGGTETSSLSGFEGPTGVVVSTR
jgi:hypothetical protein